MTQVGLLDLSLDYCEKHVVGCVFSDWDLAQRVRTIISVGDFSNEQCRQCWEIFCESANSNDFVHRLQQKKLIAFATACMDFELPLSCTEQIALEVKSASQRRRISRGIREIWDSGEDLLEGLKMLLEREEKEGATAVTDDDLPQQLYEATLAEMRRDDLSQRIPTGLRQLDGIIQGFRLGNVSVLGAEPSTGKTAFALNVAVTALRRGKRVLIFSLEMSAVQMMDRMISSIANIPYSAINNKRLTSEDADSFEKTALALTSENRLYIYDTVYMVEQMSSVIAAVKPDFVVVDFLQFCRTMERAQNTADKLEYIVSEFKRIAKVKYHRCHIMLLSQPSRQATKEGQSMFALKGSSGIEQGGDVILLLDRPCVRDATYPQAQASVRVAKNKFGYTGKVDLYFEGEYQRFRDLQQGEFFERVQTEEEKPW